MEVKIILAATRECKYLVAALRQQFIKNPHSANTLLFWLQFAIFTSQGIINILK